MHCVAEPPGRIKHLPLLRKENKKRRTNFAYALKLAVFQRSLNTPQLGCAAEGNASRARGAPPEALEGPRVREGIGRRVCTSSACSWLTRSMWRLILESHWPTSFSRKTMRSYS